MAISSKTKYYVTIALSAVGAAIGYIVGQPDITASAIMSGILVGVGLAVKELETPTAAVPPA